MSQLKKSSAKMWRICWVQLLASFLDSLGPCARRNGKLNKVGSAGNKLSGIQIVRHTNADGIAGPVVSPKLNLKLTIDSKSQSGRGWANLKQWLR